MTEERQIEVEIEVPATPEEAWQAIATGPGITAWFMPADVEPRVGGEIVHHHEAEMETAGKVTAYDPPHRFAFEESEWMPGENSAHITATEYLIEAKSGGSCVVRLVMSGFGEGEEWDKAIESFTAGWQQALFSLKLYLTHFAGQAAESLNAGASTRGDKDEIWRRLAGDLGMPAAPSKGDLVKVGAADAPELSGTVQRFGGRMLTLLLDSPAPGIGFIGTCGPGDEVFTFVRAQLFGEDAQAVAERAQAAWKGWFERRAA